MDVGALPGCHWGIDASLIKLPDDGDVLALHSPSACHAQKKKKGKKGFTISYGLTLPHPVYGLAGISLAKKKGAKKGKGKKKA